MRALKALSVALCLMIMAACGGGGGGGGGTAPPSGADTTAPTVSITAPMTGSTAVGVTTITASASDDVGVARVDFLANGTLIGSDAVAPYSISWNTTSLNRGSYNVTAKAYDAANNVQQSTNVTVTVPITASMSVVITGTTAVGTVTLAGPATPEIFGIDLSVTIPAGVDIPSAVASGVATGATPTVNEPDAIVVLASSDGFGEGEILKVNFGNISASAVPSDFGVSVLGVWDGGGIQIQ